MPTPGYIYAITTFGSSLVKIGYSLKPPTTRLKALQSGNYQRLELVAWVQVNGYARELEYIIHSRLAWQLHQREWFQVTITQEKLEKLVADAQKEFAISRPKLNLTRQAWQDAPISPPVDMKWCPFAEALPGVLAELRKEAKKYTTKHSITLLAKETGVHRNTLRFWLKGRDNMSLQTLLAVASHLNSVSL